MALIRGGPPPRARRSTLAAALTLALAAPLGGPALAAGEPVPALASSPCPPGRLVDAAFRDAALAVVDRLAVNAPGRPADGAVRTHESAGHVDPQGRAWHQVTAYQVNLGLTGALRVAPRLLPTVGRWLRWLARHIPATGANRGVVLDHWVRAGDLAESTCPPGLADIKCDDVDAFDSTAASTLLVADAYLRNGGDPALLREPALRMALESAAAAMSALEGPEGLTVAKPSHLVVYTMDMVEVVAGWRAWANLQREAYAQPQSAVNSLATSTRLEGLMRARLWDERANAWRVSMMAGSPQPGRWYADTVAQAWPLLWGVGAPEAAARDTWRRAIAPWQRPGGLHWANTTVDPDGFWWPSVAVAATCVGDEAHAKAWVARARQAWMQPRKPFAWPFQVGDLLWLAWMADPV